MCREEQYSSLYVVPLEANVQTTSLERTSVEGLNRAVVSQANMVLAADRIRL